MITRIKEETEINIEAEEIERIRRKDNGHEKEEQIGEKRRLQKKEKH